MAVQWQTLNSGNVKTIALMEEYPPPLYPTTYNGLLDLK